ncbi:hypothetical protein GUJ93_ZPchr0001g30758 [Zizania palustris]|uniref:Tyrosine specific protein phosphatases domain-containing protein n=1 Tax=Zizania palustris TaxID=103762 RepID=A0A8J5S8K5_ZIZPA|nr:hypothetical protein GUJ93_ZPchr0001g30758 [Zizania palustris]
MGATARSIDLLCCIAFTVTKFIRPLLDNISDDDDANISDLFEEASVFIDHVDHVGGKVLVHCFEGKSRSATIVLSYLMLRNKNVGLSTSSLKRHLQKAHKQLSAGSVDNAMILEIQKSIQSLRVIHGGSLSPSQKLNKTLAEC